MSISDDDADWSAEDGASVATGARGAQAGPLQRVRRRRAAVANGHVRSDRPLVGLYLVRHRVSRTGAQEHHLATSIR